MINFKNSKSNEHKIGDYLTLIVRYNDNTYFLQRDNKTEHIVIIDIFNDITIRDIKKDLVSWEQFIEQYFIIDSTGYSIIQAFTEDDEYQITIEALDN